MACKRKNRILLDDLVAFSVNCLGKRHPIVIMPHGRIKLLGHKDIKTEYNTALAFEALEGAMPRCMSLLRFWRGGQTEDGFKAPKELWEAKEEISKKRTQAGYAFQRQIGIPPTHVEPKSVEARRIVLASMAQRVLRDKIRKEAKKVFQVPTATQESAIGRCLNDIEEQYRIDVSYPKRKEGPIWKYYKRWFDEIYSTGVYSLIPKNESTDGAGIFFTKKIVEIGDCVIVKATKLTGVSGYTESKTIAYNKKNLTEWKFVD